jgi:hypothetical protein
VAKAAPLAAIRPANIKAEIFFAFMVGLRVDWTLFRQAKHRFVLYPIPEAM